MKRKQDMQWPERRPHYDRDNRLVEEEHVLSGVVIARITFDPKTGCKTSYTSGKVTLYFSENEVLIKKVIRDDNDQVSTVECYSNSSGQLHSNEGRPSKTKYSDDGKVIYLAWHHEGKKDRPSKLDKHREKLIPQPAVIRYFNDGIVENAFYRDDALTDPNDDTAAIQYTKGDAVVLKCHFRDNKIHKTDDPALLVKHDAMNLIAFAKNGKFSSARFEEPGHISTSVFNEQGELISTEEEYDLEDEPVPACGIGPLVQGLSQTMAAEQITELASFKQAQDDPSDPSLKRKREREASQRGNKS